MSHATDVLTFLTLKIKSHLGGGGGFVLSKEHFLVSQSGHEKQIYVFGFGPVFWYCRFPAHSAMLTINVPVVYMGRYELVLRGDYP